MPLFQGLGLEFAIMSYAGQLSISAAVDPALVPDADRIMRAVGDELEELASGLGLARRGRARAGGSRTAVGDS